MPIKIIERPKTLMLADFMNQDVTCTASKMGEGIGFADHEGFTNIGEYTVPPQQRIAIGKRPDYLDKDIGGIFHSELHDASNNDIEGIYKIVLRNATGLKKATILVRPSNLMYKTSPLDRSKQMLNKLGMTVPIIWAKEDSVIQLLFKPDVDGKVINYNNANNVFFLDVTVQYPYEAKQEWI